MIVNLLMLWKKKPTGLQLIVELKEAYENMCRQQEFSASKFTSFQRWPILSNTTTFLRLTGPKNLNSERSPIVTIDTNAVARGMLKGHDSKTQSLHKFKVIIVCGISRVRILLLITNNLVFLFDELLHRLGLKPLHCLC